VSCPSEAVLSVHADGELPPDEARRTETHLAGCPRCRRLVAELLGENRLLTRVLEEGAGSSEPAERRASWADRATAAALLLAAVAGVQAFSGWLGTLGEQAPFGLADTRNLMWSALFEAVFFLLREGVSMLTSLLTAFSLIAAVLLAVGLGVVFWRRRMSGGLLIAVLVALWASPASAIERRVVEKGSVTVPAGETIDDTLLAAGESVAIDGVVTGNLFAFGRRVSVRGTVKGDLITAAQRIEVTGTVEGNVFSFSEEVTYRGAVSRSVHAFAKHVGIASEAWIQGDAMAFAEEADLEGRFGRDVLACTGATMLRGEVARHVAAWTGRLTVEAPARVGGNLTALVDKKEHLNVSSGATVAGRIDMHLDDKGKAPRHSRYARPSFYVWKAIWLAAALLTGLVLHRLAPSLFAYRPADASALTKPLGIGFLVFIATPVGLVVLGLTVVGLPLSLLGLAIWLAGLYVSGIVVAAVVGWALLARRQTPPPPFALALAIGLLALTVAVSIPYLGILVRLLALLLGLGIVAVQARQAWRGATAV
jgi:anti-sigma factor RsiW/cytoskeletal protein CcmA (bactofilin family)